MPFKLNSYVSEQNHLRCHATERQYMADLEKRGLLLRIDNMLVDAEQLAQRTFQCDSGYCLRCSVSDSGASKYKGSCCTDLQVDITEEEADRVRELGRMARAELKLAPSDPLSKVVDRLVRDDFTERSPKHDLIFKHLPSGRCALSWMTPGGSLRCGINSLCMALERPLVEFKPDPCYLFPLHYAEPIPGQFFITLVTAETYQAIGADAYVTKLRCLARPQPGSPLAYTFLRNEITHCFGAEFYERMEAGLHALPALAGSLPPIEARA